VARRLVLLALATLALAASTGGCGYHLVSKGSSLPSHIRRIGVPAFANSTTRPELGQRITERVIAELVGRGKYDVTPDAKGVDAVLHGAVVSWTSRPVQLTAQDSDAQRVAVTLRASVSFEDLVEHRILWEQESYTFTAEYDVIGDPDEYFDTELDAIDEVAEDFARAVVSAILQGF
jgi:hypothetical protein